MHSNTDLVDKLRDCIDGRDSFVETMMFGGVCFQLNGNICVGVYKDWLIARVGKDAAEKALEDSACTPMDITGRPMKGWIKVDSNGWDNPKDLRQWVDLAESFVLTLPKK